MNNPPRKKSGGTRTPRSFDGMVLDIRSAAQLLGTSEKAVRARISRRVLPFRRLGGRIVFMKDDLTAFINHLPGIGVDEALANERKRREQ